MESLVDLLPLLFIGLYYLLSGRRRAQAKKTARARMEAPATESTSGEPRGATPFQSFLEQLEEAMAESAGASTPPVDPPRPTVAAPLPPRAEPTLSPEFHATTGSFDAPTAVDHDAHGFGRENPLSEETFERRPAFAQAPRPAPVRFDPHGLRKQPSATTASQPDWRRRLRDPHAALDAYVLQTLFGARGGRHGAPSRRGR